MGKTSSIVRSTHMEFIDEISSASRSIDLPMTKETYYSVLPAQKQTCNIRTYRSNFIR